MDNVTEDYTNFPDYRAGLLIWKVVPPFLILLGTIGNILSIVVLTRKSIKISTTMALYLTFLAFSDLLVLYTGLLRQWILYVFKYDVRHLSEAACKIHMWLLFTLRDFSGWILLAVTLERVISVWCPLSAKTKCSRKYATALLIIILLFLLALNSHVMYGMVNKGTVEEHDTGTRSCSVIDTKYGSFYNLTWPWIDVCVFCLIPFSVIVVGNGCILFRVIRSQRKTKARSVPSINTNQSRISHRSGPKQSSLTAILFTLNTVFLFTTFPVSIYMIGSPPWEESGTVQDYATLDLWWAVVNMLMYTNNSSNFLLYCLRGTQIRQEVKRIFCPKSRQGSNIPSDIYSRTTFNAELASYTPSVTPDRDGTCTPAHKGSNILQIPKGTNVHSSDKSDFGSSNIRHPNSALTPANSMRTISFTSASIDYSISSDDNIETLNFSTISTENVATPISSVDNVYNQGLHSLL